MTLFFVVLLEKREFQRKKKREIFVHPKDPLNLKQSIIDQIELKNIKTKLNTKKIQKVWVGVMIH